MVWIDNHVSVTIPMEAACIVTDIRINDPWSGLLYIPDAYLIIGPGAVITNGPQNRVYLWIHLWSSFSLNGSGKHFIYSVKYWVSVCSYTKSIPMAV